MAPRERRKTMASIKVLPELLVNQIAAGEVVERPASVVKELIENSIDAGADRIELTIEGGGCKLIRVTDNGVGMTPEDLKVAWLSHSTSKLENSDGLNRILTMGFRGEALASIGSVSQASITSRPRGALEGAKISISGGKIDEFVTCGAPEGTTVEVRNLFFNVPARKKFLRTHKTEQGHAVEAFTRLAIAHPLITFHLECDTRRPMRLYGQVDQLERIRAIMGEEIADQLSPVLNESDALTVRGYAGRPSANRANTQMIYTYLNGRYIRDKVIMRAISEAYRGLLPTGRFPVVFLMLNIDPERVDVNVHPCKIEVRFRESDAVFRQTLAALKNAAKEWGGGNAVKFSDQREAGGPRSGLPDNEPSGQRNSDIQSAISDFIQTSITKPTAQSSHDGKTAPVSFKNKFQAESHVNQPPREISGVQSHRPPERHRRFYQFHSSYIVEETDDGINIIDQHALHERILFESIMRRKSRGVERQRLLMPAIVELRPRDLNMVLELKDSLESMGVEIEDFGGNAVAVHAVPNTLGNIEPSALIVDMLDRIREESGMESREYAAVEMLACKGAVKANQPLTEAQIAQLLKRRDEMELPPTCPHGRPTTLHLSGDELARKFGRK